MIMVPYSQYKSNDGRTKVKPTAKRLVALTVLLLPIVFLGAIAWLVWTGLAIGWNILDEIADNVMTEPGEQK